MGSAENGGGQNPAPEGRQIGTPPPPGMFKTPSLKGKIILEIKSPTEMYLFFH